MTPQWLPRTSSTLSVPAPKGLTAIMRMRPTSTSVTPPSRSRTMAEYIPATSVLGMEPEEVGRILADGATLPAAFYTSAEIARIEDELVWRRAWQPVGIEPELRKVGDYFTSHVSGTFFDVPVVVVRDEGMQIRAFVNVCRHRAH